MFQHFFSDYLVKLQETNHQWWHDFEVNKAVVNSPLNKAMQEVNFEDTAKLFEQAANQPAAILKLQAQWWEQQLQIWQNVALAGNQAQIIEAEKGDKRFSNEACKMKPCIASSNNPTFCSVRPILIPSSLWKA